MGNKMICTADVPKMLCSLFGQNREIADDLLRGPPRGLTGAECETAGIWFGAELRPW